MQPDSKGEKGCFLINPGKPERNGLSWGCSTTAQGPPEGHQLALLWDVSQAGKEEANSGMTEETSRHVPGV